MAEVEEPIIQITRPRRAFIDECRILAVAVFPDGRRMVTGSYDKILRVWDLMDGTVLKKMEGHGSQVEAVAVSGNGKLIASGDRSGNLIAWDGDTGESITQLETIKFHTKSKVTSLNFSPDSGVLAAVSRDKNLRFWRTDTWQVQQNPIGSHEDVFFVRYSPSGELLAIATANDIQIWNLTVFPPVQFSALNPSFAWHDFGIKRQHIMNSLVWTPDGRRLFSTGSRFASIIWEWDTSTWKQVGRDWRGHTDYIYALAVNSTGTLVASASSDTHVRLWRISDGRTIYTFKHSRPVRYVTFSADGKRILSGGETSHIKEWAVPDDALPEDTPKEQVLDVSFQYHCHLIWLKETLPKNAPEGTNSPRHSNSKIFSINTTVRDACLKRDLTTAQELLTQQINFGENNYNAYANRSFVLARKGNWANALHDALRSVSIQPSLTGYISKGIALCGNMEFKEAMKAFDLAFMFTDTDSNTVHLLLLIKAIALFNANQHEEAMLRIQELATTCPNADTLACHVVEANLLIQLGITALDEARYNDAADHFTAAINSGVLSYNQVTHPKYEIFVVLFGWDLKASWQSANQNRCDALRRAGRLKEAHKAYKCMMDICDEATKTSCLDWSTSFKKECNALYISRGDAALAAGVYDGAIELYSAAIDLDSATDNIFANRCKANLGKMLWEEALVDAQKVTELNPASYLGYKLKHAALHGGQRYDEAIEAFQFMLVKLDDTHDPEMQALRRQYISPSEAQSAIRQVIHAQLEDTPPRLLDTSTGRLYNRDAQIDSFQASTRYKKLLSATMKYADIRLERIQDAVAMFFQYVMLSHRWEGKEPILQDVQRKNVYKLNPVDGIAKLQSFCKVARDWGYRWAWSDTCCIDKTNNVDLQESINSMFVWYRHSGLTIVYLSDVRPSSKCGALAKSAWNKRGWTLQEFLAPRVVLFYQKDWSLYLDDRSSNHKESAVIMRELGDATGINAQALVAFRPEMRGAREKLRWSSKRVTTLQEDIAYSLFGTFGVHLSPIYGEKKQNALGRLLQEIIAQSGDITCLDWVGKSSEFNSCLPANIASYVAPPSALPSLPETEMQTSVASLRDAGVLELASQLYTTVDRLTAPRFAHRRLHLPCIVFTVTEVTPWPDQAQEEYLPEIRCHAYFTYMVKADGLDDLLITTEDKLIPFSHAMPIRQKFLLVRPWDRNLLELHDFVALPNPAADPESDLRALRLIVRLGRPFSGFLLAQQWGGEYKRIAADHNIIARVKDMASVRDVMDVRTLEIL